MLRQAYNEGLTVVLNQVQAAVKLGTESVGISLPIRSQRSEPMPRKRGIAFEFMASNLACSLCM